MHKARMARFTARIFFETLAVATKATGVQMRVLNYEEAAGRMGVVRRSLERLIARGEGPSVIHLSPRRRGILESDFEKWLISRRRAAPGEVSSNEGCRWFMSQKRIGPSTRKVAEPAKTSFCLATTDASTKTRNRSFQHGAPRAATHAQADFLRIAEDVTWVNPHLNLTATWDRGGCGPVEWTVPATDPTWCKWRPSDPTSTRSMSGGSSPASIGAWPSGATLSDVSATSRDSHEAARRPQRADHYRPAPGLPAHRLFGSRQIEREPAMSSSSAKAIADLIEGVTEKWAKQRKAEERDSSARLRRDDRFVYYARPISLKEAAYRVMGRACMAASAGGTLPANPRQIMYAARPEILKIADRDNLDSQYFCQTLLPDYIREYRSTCAGWDIAWDDRGHFVEPHTGKAFGFGTLNVRDYIASYASPAFEDAGFTDAAIKTHGPEGRYGGVLYIEKEGFMPLLERARYISGFSIAKTLCSDTRRYTFKNEFETIDLGLRLYDVHELGLYLNRCRSAIPAKTRSETGSSTMARPRMRSLSSWRVSASSSTP
jgi:hypothetical protein